MSDTKELVERARFVASGQDDPHSQIIDELADALEAKDREIAELRYDLKRVYQNATDELNRAEALAAKLEKAKAALEPFAKFAEKANRFVEARANNGGSPIMPVNDFRLIDFKRAREALEAIDAS